MKAFIDTSSLFKRYLIEPGRDQLLTLLEGVSVLSVAPTLQLEIASAITRRLTEKSMTQKEAQFVVDQFSQDFSFFQLVQFNDALVHKGMDVIAKYKLRALDSIQLSAGCLSGCDVFITSDKTLYQAAKKELKKTVLIEK